MSSRAPFDDSSDDDDSDNSTKEPTPATKPEVAAATEEDEEKEESDDQAGKAEENTENKNSQASSRIVIGDDSDDEGDVEFDDDGAVVGTSAPSRKSNASKITEAPEPGVTNPEGGAETPSKSKVPKPPQRAEVLEADRPSEDVSFHITKLPNLVGIQPEAFDQSTYSAADEEEQYRGYVHNMIRWRYKRDDHGNLVRNDAGNLIRESNSRLVKWEDGSFTLHIGNESFDVDAIDSSQGSYAGLNGFVYLSQKANFSANDGEETEPEANTGTVLECVGPVRSRLIARPSSLQSEAHKSLTLAVRQRTIKKARIAQYVTQEDPEKAKAMKIRTKEDTDKIQSRKKSSYRSYGSRHRSPGMNRRYLEEDDEAYDSINIRALKKRSGDMDDDMDDYGDDSDGDDDYNDTFRGRNARKRVKKEESEEEEEDELVFEAESDEDNITHLKAHKKKRSRQAVLEDDDDD